MDYKKSNKANTIIIILIFVGVFLYNTINPRAMVKIQVEDTDMTLSGYEEITYTIPFDSIDRITYQEEVEYPEETKSLLCGTYNNEQWGEHILYVSGKISSCIVMETEEGTYVFNYESEKTTKALYDALLELLYPGMTD